jgi:hypothetical protein
MPKVKIETQKVIVDQNMSSELKILFQTFISFLRTYRGSVPRHAGSGRGGSSPGPKNWAKEEKEVGQSTPAGIGGKVVSQVGNDRDVNEIKEEF